MKNYRRIPAVSSSFQIHRVIGVVPDSSSSFTSVMMWTASSFFLFGKVRVLGFVTGNATVWTSPACYAAITELDGRWWTAVSRASLANTTRVTVPGISEYHSAIFKMAATHPQATHRKHTHHTVRNDTGKRRKLLGCINSWRHCSSQVVKISGVNLMKVYRPSSTWLRDSCLQWTCRNRTVLLLRVILREVFTKVVLKCDYYMHIFTTE